MEHLEYWSCKLLFHCMISMYISDKRMYLLFFYRSSIVACTLLLMNTLQPLIHIPTSNDFQDNLWYSIIVRGQIQLCFCVYIGKSQNNCKDIIMKNITIILYALYMSKKKFKNPSHYAYYLPKICGFDYYFFRYSSSTCSCTGAINHMQLFYT